MELLDLLVQSARRHVNCLGEDVEAWRVAHDLATAWHNLGDSYKETVEEGIRLFERILALDLKHREFVAAKTMDWSDEIDADLRDVLGQWARVAGNILSLLAVCEEHGYFPDDGVLKLRELHIQAKAMLTPDAEFFGDDAASSRDKAIEDHRGGRTEEMPV